MLYNADVPFLTFFPYAKHPFPNDTGHYRIFLVPDIDVCDLHRRILGAPTDHQYDNRAVAQRRRNRQGGTSAPAI